MMMQQVWLQKVEQVRGCCSVCHSTAGWSTSCAGHPVKAPSKDLTPGQERVKAKFSSSVTTCADSSKPLLLSGTEHSLRMMKLLQNPCPPFDTRSNSRCCGKHRYRIVAEKRRAVATTKVQSKMKSKLKN